MQNQVKKKDSKFKGQVVFFSFLEECSNSSIGMLYGARFFNDNSFNQLLLDLGKCIR